MQIRLDPPSRTTSWTEISTFRQCPHKHKLQYLDRWRTDKLSRPLAIGILWHDILDQHYQGVRATGDVRDPGKDALNAIVELLNSNGASDPHHPTHDIGNLCLWMYHGYRRWAAKADLPWKIIEVEREFEVQLPNSEFMLVGRIDLVIEYKRHLWVIDHKAVRNLPKGKELDLDDQTPLYIWAMRQCGYDVMAALLSHTRTERLKTREMADEERYSRDYMYRDDDEIDTVVAEAVASIEAAHSPEQRHPRHPNPSTCKWMCQFVEPCIGGRKAPHLEEQLLIGLGFRRAEPKLTVVRKT